MRLRDLLRVVLAWGRAGAVPLPAIRRRLGAARPHLRPLPKMVVVLAPEDEGQGTGERLH